MRKRCAAFLLDDTGDELFTFRLARDLGMTVAELGRRMSYHEFVAWSAFYDAEAELAEKARRQQQR